MHNSAIYDPHASETPSQAKAASQRLARLRRIGSHARPDTPIALRRPAFPVAALLGPTIEVTDRDLLFSLWVERQRQKHQDSLQRFEQGAISSAIRPPVELIQKTVAEHYGMDWRIMFSAVRVASVVRPRQIAMYLSKTLTDRSLPEIGRRFGGRDHTTVLHAVRKIAALIESDLSVSAEINHLKSLIAARHP